MAIVYYAVMVSLLYSAFVQFPSLDSAWYVLVCAAVFAFRRFVDNPMRYGTVEFGEEGLLYRNELYAGYIPWASATGVEMCRGLLGRKLAIYGDADIDIENIWTNMEYRRRPGWLGMLFSTTGSPDYMGHLKHKDYEAFATVNQAPGKLFNSHKGRIVIYPSKHFDIERLYRDLLLKGIPAMQTVKLPRA